MNPLKMLSRGGAVSEPSDADFENVTLLLHGDGTNGAQNNTFLDSSTNNFTITRNGNTTQGTFSPFSKVDGRWGNYFNGATSDAVQAPNNAVFDYGTGDVTVEFWVYLNSLSAIQNLIDCGPTGGSGFTSWAMDISTSGYVQFVSYLSGNLQLYTATSNPLSANQWYHIAYTRSSGTNYLFVNGAVCTATGGVSQQINSGGNPVTIGRGRYSGFERPTTGYFSNVRITKGGALYTSAFTPSTTPLTTTVGSGTVSLLTCQSNRFVDKSVNAFAITVLATPRVTPFSPFPTLTAYDAATNGGSGYFDGSGDYLSVASNSAFALGTGDFTMECWAYYSSFTREDALALANWDGATWGANKWSLHLDHVTQRYKISFWVNNINSGSPILLSTTTIQLNTWYHIAVTRSGSTWRLFVNGVQEVSTTSSTSIDGGNNSPIYVGGATIASQAFNGYLSNTRLVKGTATYTSAFTPPTAPLTAVSGTSLLANFTNAGIIDNSMSNNLETVGNAQIDTTTKKYGTGSMEFDGTGDNLTIPSNDTLWLGAGQFTIEMWLYPNDASSEQMLLSGSDTGSIFLGMNIDGANRIALGRKGVAVDNFVSYTYSTGAWIHLAVTRDSSNNVRFFVDGTQVGSTGSNSNSFANSALNIGFEPTQKYFTGFIDDLRITKGKARYTTTFTPPTAALPDIGD